MDLTTITQSQEFICRQYGQGFVPADLDSTLGFATQTVGKQPIHGLRHPPAEGTNGWYIWLGEFCDTPDFFSPVHTCHLLNDLPNVIRYWGLPPGCRFLLGPDLTDVWFDPKLLTAE